LTSTKPKVQRKANHSREGKVAVMRAPLSKELSQQYGLKNVSIRKGDSVTVARGDYSGHEGKVISVLISKMRINVEGINMSKLDGTSKPVPISPSKVMINKLDLSDKKRKSFLEEKRRSKSKE